MIRLNLWRRRTGPNSNIYRLLSVKAALRYYHFLATEIEKKPVTLDLVYPDGDEYTIKGKGIEEILDEWDVIEEDIAKFIYNGGRFHINIGSQEYKVW